MGLPFIVIDCFWNRFLLLVLLSLLLVFATRRSRFSSSFSSSSIVETNLDGGGDEFKGESICSRNNDASTTVSTSTSSRSTFTRPLLLPSVFFFSFFVFARFHPTPASPSSSSCTPPSLPSSSSSSSSSSLSVASPSSSSFSSAASRPLVFVAALSSSMHLTVAAILPNFNNHTFLPPRSPPPPLPPPAADDDDGVHINGTLRVEFLSNLSSLFFSSSSPSSLLVETTLETRVPSLLPQSVTSKKVVVSPSSPSSFAIDFACTPAEEVATTTVKIACFLDTEFSFSMGTCAMEGSRPTIVGTFGCNA